jgi:rod shape-determining protein MreC
VKRSNWFLGILAVFTAILVFIRPNYGWQLRRFLAPNFYGAQSSALDLALENERLKTELAKLKNIQSQLPTKPPEYIRAVVYSRYPMNFKNELTLSVGKNGGVSEGAAVVFDGVLIGRITKVFDDTSLVETVFDGRFGAAVRIGSAGVDALLRGGSFPGVVLIPAKSDIKTGDIVYSASPDFPYGLPIAEIGEVKASSDRLFKEASLNFVYDINAVENVLVAKNAP